jgi:hypothetical protein
VDLAGSLARIAAAVQRRCGLGRCIPRYYGVTERGVIDMTLRRVSVVVGIALVALVLASCDLFQEPNEMTTRYYDGESLTGNLQEALDSALQQLGGDLGEGGVFDALASWSVVEVTGRLGGIAGFRTVRVRISATRGPSW